MRTNNQQENGQNKVKEDMRVAVSDTEGDYMYCLSTLKSKEDMATRNHHQPNTITGPTIRSYSTRNTSQDPADGSRGRR